MTASPVLLQSLGNGSIWDQYGNAQNGHQVFVYQRGTTTQVTVYQDVGLTQPLTQPLTTGANGANPGGIPGYVAADVAIDLFDQTTNATMPAEPVAIADLVGPDPNNANTPTIGRGRIPVAGVSVTPPNTAATIEGWINGNAYGISGGAVNSNGVLLSANLSWPDGATGVYTANTIDANTNAVTSCSYTYVWGSGSHAFTETITIDPSTGAALTTSITETS